MCFIIRKVTLKDSFMDIYERLAPLQNVPISTHELKGVFGDLSAPQAKINRLEQEGYLISLKRGLYLVASKISGKMPDLSLVANHIYSPSYVSLHYALRYYGLIPEYVHSVTSITTNHSREFSNSIGNFWYYQVSPAYFPIGIHTVETEGTNSLMATPEKALCDLIQFSKHVPSRSMISMLQFLEEDIRFDIDILHDFNINILEACESCAHNRQAITNLIKLCKQ